MNKIRILVTGGHMTPAFAVISELQKQKDYEFIWVGHKYNQHGNKNVSAEYTTVTNKHIKFINLPAGKLTRNWGGGDWKAGLINLFKVPYGFVVSTFVLLRYRPKLIISFGGYLALPIVIIGRIFGIKVVTHEQTAVTGLTNKILPKFANKVMISWPSSARYYPPEKTVLTGNPIRPEVFEVHSDSFQVNQELPTIYVTGGNQGSHKVKQTIFAILDDLLEVANVIHQTGNSTVTGDFEYAQSQAEIFKNKKGKYYVKSFIYEQEIGEAYSKADLVIARSGANTVYEMLAMAKPSIFIPIPWVTHNEQYINASLAAETGIAKIINETELTPDKLMEDILTSLKYIGQNQGLDGNPIEQAKHAAAAQIVPDAANLIVKEISQYL